MFKNHIIFTIRSVVKKEKFMFFIIATGLALSVSAFFLLSEHVRYEDSYDTFFEDADNVYRIQTDFTNKKTGELLKFPMLPSTMTDIVRERVPGVEHVSWISPKLNCAANVADEDEVFNLEYTFLADSNFFSVFPFEFIAGNSQTSLRGNRDIVLSETQAKRLFGDASPLDKQVRVIWAAFDNIYTVTGVFKDVPENSHLKLDALITHSEMRQQQKEWNYHYTYFKLYDNGNIEDVEAKGKELYEELYREDLNQENLDLAMKLTQVNKIHLYSDVSREIKERGDYQLIKLIKILSLLVLVICVINYLNLSSAQYSKRKKEIDLRKTLGAGVKNFQTQLLIENMASISVGVVIGIILTLLVSPYYSENFNIPMEPVTFLTLQNMVFVVAFIVVVAVLATIFPMVMFFKNDQSKRSGKRHLFNFRNIFIGIQYILVIAIVFSMLIITRQVNFMNSKDLGFNKQGILFMSCPPLKMSDEEKLAKMKLLIDELEPLAEITSVSNSLTIPGRFYNNLSSFNKFGDPGEKIIGYFSNADFNYLETYGIRLLAGRNFHDDYKDNYGIIINKTLMGSLGFEKPGDAVGKEIEMNNDKYTVIGVMVYQTSSFISIRYNTNTLSPGTLEQVKAGFQRVFPGAPFDYQYMEEFYGRLLKKDRNLANLSVMVSAIIMILAVMGLISVSSFIIGQRIKEIAIRKVLGGSFTQNMVVLLRDYLVILGIAITLSLSVSVYYMLQWLDNFSYKTNLSFDLLVIPVVLVFVMTILVVLYNAVRVESSNPIRSLKSA